MMLVEQNHPEPSRGSDGTTTREVLLKLSTRGGGLEGQQTCSSRHGHGPSPCRASADYVGSPLVIYHRIRLVPQALGHVERPTPFPIVLRSTTFYHSHPPRLS